MSRELLPIEVSSGMKALMTPCQQIMEYAKACGIEIVIAAWDPSMPGAQTFVTGCFSELGEKVISCAIQNRASRERDLRDNPVIDPEPAKESHS